MTKIAPIIVLLFTAAYAAACSFCGPPSGRATLREQVVKADAVVFGTLKNPQLGSDPTTGTTEFHTASVLKSHAVIEKRPVIVLPKYLPIASGDTGEAVVFFADRKGVPDSLRVQSSNVALMAYLVGQSKLDAKDISAQLKFAFDHLDSTDATVAEDAFLEFAKASDTEILKIKAQFDAAKVRSLVQNPRTPGNKLGVYALLLGLCGEKSDAALMAGLIQGKLTERTITALGGLLTGIVMLDAQAGWKAVGDFLTETQHNYAVRLSAFSTVRYLEATKPKESREPILAIYKELLADNDMAELAMEDLRRWKWWDHTDSILKLFGQPGFQAKGARNAILRYALSCPESAAVAFVAAMRKQDPEWVKGVEERMKALE